jgi:hypothetical protein
VKTQIWIAITIYVLVAIIKKELGLSVSTYQILQVVSVTVFERVPHSTGPSERRTQRKFRPIF